MAVFGQLIIDVCLRLLYTHKVLNLGPLFVLSDKASSIVLPWSRSAFAFFNFSASDGVGVKIGDTGDGAKAASSSDPSESESNEIAEFFDSGRDIFYYSKLLEVQGFPWLPSQTDVFSTFFVTIVARRQISSFCHSLQKNEKN